MLDNHFWPMMGATSSEFGKSLPQQIADYIATEILQGRFRPGERLKEEDLAAKFQTSRAPVREALYLLQIDGLVERQPRRGTVVKAYTEKEIRELYEVRQGLEQIAVERLRHAWSRRAAERFHTVLADMEQALADSDAEAYSESNEAFHELIFDLAGNEVLLRLYRQLQNLLRLLLRLSTQEAAQMRASYEEHRAIVAALERGDFEEAKRVLAQNVDHGLHRALGTRTEVPPSSRK
ncbi:MAG: GntR family transcriptional regulator [Alicyclobacillus macrosporangiidus]|uniref:GntR family transcriptional regulator n=1 Tax=Alicyclobacillus macrosporangiidus TaxID=392015 RepID=UPI0026ED2702|nr:GntR family transcriptional regulator [Alicyclobacillus macrosporangiidus]MCL6597790.1 GntR family transcriptional regulator [Alicyclobacillus macrosporangiidus]